ncbi:MAG: TerC family protein [Chthonomonadales bacterium]|nr:TerC family protein [Chthonomonadales bacterium]
MWLGFGALVVAVLAIDLGLFNRKAHTPSFKEAAAWSAVWVSLAVLFGVWVFVREGHDLGLQFATGYLVELSLSVDNVFLFAVLFTHFQVARRYQHRLLFWGIIGAVVMRGIMIAAGTALINRFHWVVIVFGVFLIWTGIRMFLHRNREMDVSEMAVLRWLRRHVRISETYDGQRFFTRKDGALYATPLFVVLVLVELTDLMFAVDSIPAVLAISRDPFIVFTSNVFAILGLRSFYFLLAGVMEMFEYLTVGLAGVLVFVGVKMLGIWHIPTTWSLAVIVAILAAAIAASLLKARKRVTVA